MKIFKKTLRNTSRRGALRILCETTYHSQETRPNQIILPKKHIQEERLEKTVSQTSEERLNTAHPDNLLV